jgi:hypothetical protein
MHWLRRIVRVAGVVLGLILLSLAFASAYLRLDKEDVLRDVRGTYQDFVTLDSWESAQSRFQLLQLRNHRGDAVTNVYFRRPLELDPHHRIFLIYAGAKTRDKILTLIPERSDLVLVSVQYPYDSPDGLLEHLRWPLHIRQAAFRAVAGGMLALSFLHVEEDLDIDRLTVIGVSVGVPFATMHGALDERVPTVVLIHGGGDLPAQVRAIAEPRWIATPASVMAAILFHTFEPLRYVDRISPRKLVMIAARHDTMLPLETIEKLYARADEPKEMIWTESGHVRSKDTDLIADIVRQIDRYLE